MQHEASVFSGAFLLQKFKSYRLHGTAFSINFEKPFVTVVDDNKSNKDNRQISLIRELGVSLERVAWKGKNVDVIKLDENIEWHEELEIKRAYSIEYFKQALAHE